MFSFVRLSARQTENCSCTERNLRICDFLEFYECINFEQINLYNAECFSLILMQEEFVVVDNVYQTAASLQSGMIINKSIL